MADPITEEINTALCRQDGEEEDNAIKVQNIQRKGEREGHHLVYTPQWVPSKAWKDGRFRGRRRNGTEWSFILRARTLHTRK